MKRMTLRRRYDMPEIHWYEAHGIGSREFKIKRILSE